MPIGRVRAKTSESGAGSGFPMMLPFENQNPFYGTLDGNEHTIYNLYVTGKAPSEGDIKGVGNALIGYNCGTVKNLEVTGRVGGTRRSAGIVGFNGKSGLVEGCSSEADVGANGNGSNRGTGGIVGTNQGKILYCVNRGSVDNYGMAGGIAGINDGGTVQYCCNIGKVTSSQPRAGAIVGGNGTELKTPGSTVTDCYYYFASCNKGTSGSSYDSMPSDTKAFTKNGKIMGGSETVFAILERDCPGKFKKSKTDGMPTLPWLDAEEIDDPGTILPDVEHEITVEDPEGGSLKVVVNGMTLMAPATFKVKELTEIKVIASLTDDLDTYTEEAPFVKISNEKGKSEKIEAVHTKFPPFIYSSKVKPIISEDDEYDGNGQKLTITAEYNKINYSLQETTQVTV